MFTERGVTKPGAYSNISQPSPKKPSPTAVVRTRPKYVITGLGKIKVDDINRVAFVHHALHRFLEDRWYFGHRNSHPQGGVVALTKWCGVKTAALL